MTQTEAQPAQPVSTPSARRRTEKVLRDPGFLRRAKPLLPASWLKPLLAQGPRRSVGEWIVMGAEETVRRTAGAAVPGIWLDRLAERFQVKRPPACAIAPEFFEALPKAVWQEPSLLGEWLAAARALAAHAPRQGRAGRTSIGCVYTPASVAREIVAEVHVGPRRVVDPACGPGVFLLEAFQRAYHRRLEGGAAPEAAASAALSHELTGIDIDAEALAVAEFSLRLLALRSSGLREDVPIDLRLADALEPLDGLENRCECIVGNPPYIEGRGLSAAQLAGLRKKFRCAATGKINLFAAFVERSLSLLAEGGVLALVLPATFQRNTRYRALREVLLEHTLEAIKPLNPGCFGERVVETVVLRVRKQRPRKTSRVELAAGSTLQSALPLGPVLRFCDHLAGGIREEIAQMERRGVPLAEHFEVRDGISTGFQPFPQRLLGTVAGDAFTAQDGTRRPFDPAAHRKVIDGTEFNTYTPVRWSGRFIEYDKAHEHAPPHPGRPFNCQLRDPGLYDRAEKLLTRQTARGLIATVDRERYFVRNSVHVTFARPSELFGPALSLDALCACFNSALYTRYLLAVTGENGVLFPQVHIADLKRLPILPALLAPGGALAGHGAALLRLHASSQTDEAAILAERHAIDNLLRTAFEL